MARVDHARAEALVIPSVRFHKPASQLSDLVTSYYVVDAPGPVSDHLHPEWGNVRFNLAGRWEVEQFTTRPGPPPSDAALFGPTDRSRSINTDGGTMMGVGLTPLGWVTLIGEDASEAANRVVELDGHLGTPGREIAARLRASPDDAARVALLDRVLGAHAAGQGPRCPLTVRIDRALLGAAPRDVAGFADAAAVDGKQLARGCQRAFGFTPKRLIRRQRFLRTLAAMREHPDRPLSESIDPDYYDQAHFIHDFHQYMGMSPRAYFSSPRELIRRAAAERTRILDAPLQGLHRSA